MAKPTPSGTKRPSSARTKGPTPRGTSPKAAARANATKAAVKTKPGASTPTPGSGTPKPGASTPKPGASTPTPGSGTPKPGASATKPGASTAKVSSTAAPIASVSVSKGEASGGSAKAAPKASGRFTPKATKRVAPPPVSSGRYTPPIPRNKRSSPPWVPVLMLSLLILGGLSIVLDYLGVLPFGTSAWYLLVGLVLVAAGFGVATQYR